jgi:D-amino peptidase
MAHHRRSLAGVVVCAGLIIALVCGVSAHSLSNHNTPGERSVSEAKLVLRDGPSLLNKPRILLSYDMEGISNVDRFSMVSCDTPDDYARGVSGLVADVNAVIDGLFAAGAGTVMVSDGHGSGCDAPNLPPDRLDRRASYVDLKSDTRPVYKRKWDAVVLVGEHAGSTSGGFLPHTVVFGFTRLVNGRAISESELMAYRFGESGIPVIFVSGDDALKASLRETMPWIEYVQVKRTVSVSSAIPGDAKVAARDLREGAIRAMSKINAAPPLRVTTPFKAGLRALPPMTSFRILKGVPGVVLNDETVEFTAANFDEAQRGWGSLVGVGNTVLRLDMHEKPEYKTKTRVDAWLEAEALAAKKTPPR